MRHRSPLAALAAAVAVTLATSLPAAGAAPTLTATVVQSGLVNPWDVGFLPDGRMIVTERPGRIRVYASGAAGAPLVTTITVPNVRAEGEAGLMGVAVDRDFVRHPYVYVCASRSASVGWRNDVLRYRVSGNTWSGPTTILGGMLANTIHDGCALEMDRFYRLWVSMGDANNAALAQNTSSRNGKILRITRTGGVPADNPRLPGQSGPTAVYTWGHRNPQGIAPRPNLSGQMFAIEHGPAVNDEINLLRAGANYGWPRVTGSDGAGGYADPSWSSGGSTIATSGGAFVDNAAWADWNGHLFVATLKEADLRRFSVSADGTVATAQQTLYNGSWGRLRAVARGPAGQLYLTTSNGSNDRVIRLAPTTPRVDRRGGTDRYSGAAAVSAAAFRSTPVSAAFVVTGENWPDGLSASAAAGTRHNPLLLVRRNDVPTATANELSRLQPQRIFVVGGPASVSDAVLARLDAYTAGPVTRIGGVDRYDGSVNVSRSFFAPGVRAAFIATGQNWPDALAAGAAAGTWHSPVLLVRSDAIPSATAAELRRLAPGRIFIVGGPVSVSEAVRAQLDAYTAGPVLRFAGSDRYQAAGAVADYLWDGFDVAYLTTGQNWPDGLVAGAAAAAVHSPVLLATATSLPTATGQALVLGHPTQVVAVGGTASLSSGLLGRLATLQGRP